MNTSRDIGKLLLTIVLAGWGVYHAVYAAAMLPAPASLLLLVTFSLQAIFAFVAAIGVWFGRSWAGAALILLGVSIALTALIEGLVLGIIGWLYALLIAVAAILIAFLLAAWVGGRRE